MGDEIPEFDPCKPRSARLHDFWLGGKDHFAADRAAGADALEAYQDIASSARATRAFLVRAVRFLAAQEGVRQFLDIGAGLPAAGSANTHEAALAVSPQCRVLYMDNDPAVGNHIIARLTSDIDGCGYAEADLRHPDELLATAAQKLDFTRPVAVMLVAVLHLISDAEVPRAGPPCARPGSPVAVAGQRDRRDRARLARMKLNALELTHAARQIS